VPVFTALHNTLQRFTMFSLLLCCLMWLW